MPNSEAKDEDYLMALAAMQELMKEPSATGEWFEKKEKNLMHYKTKTTFNSLGSLWIIN